jgi:hypothetical protein
MKTPRSFFNLDTQSLANIRFAAAKNKSLSFFEAQIFVQDTGEGQGIVSRYCSPSASVRQKGAIE